MAGLRSSESRMVGVAHYESSERFSRFNLNMIHDASPMLELRHLRSLLALREAGNLSRAAELLQPHAVGAVPPAQARSRSTTTLRCSSASEPACASRAAGPAPAAAGRRVLPQVEDAERDMVRLAQGDARRSCASRVECHTCFDWLMPAMDEFRAALARGGAGPGRGLPRRSGRAAARGPRRLVIVLGAGRRRAGVDVPAAVPLRDRRAAAATSIALRGKRLARRRATSPTRR